MKTKCKYQPVTLDGSTSVGTPPNYTPLNHPIMITNVTIDLKEFKSFGTTEDGCILYVNESKLDRHIIKQIRNYLDSQEKKLRSKKRRQLTERY